MALTLFNEEEPSMASVRDQYGKLSGVVNSLNETTRTLLLRERREFLAAYRAHTYKIHNELRVLRARIADEQSAQQRDSKVKRLTEDLEWYRQEAFTLDDRSVKLKDALHTLKERLDVAEDDRRWLLRELDRTRNATQVLRVALSNVGADKKIIKDATQSSLVDAGVGGSHHRLSTNHCSFDDKAALDDDKAASGSPGSRPGSGFGDEASGNAFLLSRGLKSKRDEEDAAGRRTESSGAAAAVRAALAAERSVQDRLRLDLDRHRRATGPVSDDCAALRRALVESIAASTKDRTLRAAAPKKRDNDQKTPKKTQQPPAVDDDDDDPSSNLAALDMDRFTSLERIRILEAFARSPAGRQALATLETNDLR